MRIHLSVQKFFRLPAFTVLALCSLPAFAEGLLSSTQQSAAISVRNVQVQGLEVQGEIVNHTADTVISAGVLVSHSWLWADETHPGADDPGWVDIYPLTVNIPPGGSAPFHVNSSRPAPQRSDGMFQTSVSISRFETVPGS